MYWREIYLVMCAVFFFTYSGHDFFWESQEINYSHYSVEHL